MNNKDMRVFEKMVKYCDEINATLAEFDNDKNNFLNSATAKNAISMCILQIGELVGHLHYETVEEFPQIPWRKIRGMRNIAAHNYESFDWEIVWYIATVEVKELKAFCQKVIADFE